MLIEVDENAVITIPESFINQLGWTEGDTLEINKKDGGFILARVEKTL